MPKGSKLIELPIHLDEMKRIIALLESRDPEKQPRNVYFTHHFWPDELFAGVGPRGLQSARAKYTRGKWTIYLTNQSEC